MNDERKQRVRNFVCGELRTCGLKDSDSVVTVFGKKYSAYVTQGISQIEVPFSRLASILDFKEACDRSKNFSCKKERNTCETSCASCINNYQYQKARGSIQHEAGHLAAADIPKTKNFHRKISAFNKAIDISISISSLALCCNMDSNTLRTIYFSCIATHAVSVPMRHLLSNAYSRQQEWDADESILNDAKILRAKARYFHSARNKNYRTNLLATHPRPGERAERFKERAEALEKGLPRPPRKNCCRRSCCVVS